jgi:hypothetical protein
MGVRTGYFTCTSFVQTCIITAAKGRPLTENLYPSMAVVNPVFTSCIGTNCLSICSGVFSQFSPRRDLSEEIYNGIQYLVDLLNL